MHQVEKSNDLDIKRKRQELRVLDAQITERKLYMREQEALINDLIQSGNTKLMELNHEILVGQQQLRQIKTDIRTFRQDKLLMEEDLEQLRIQITTITGPGFNMGIVQAG